MVQWADALSGDGLRAARRLRPVLIERGRQRVRALGTRTPCVGRYARAVRWRARRLAACGGSLAPGAAAHLPARAVWCAAGALSSR
eukprot:1324961-Alexandrium_andersonii.AAC.1